MIDLDPIIESEKLKLVSNALSSSEDGIKFGMTLRGDVLDLLAKDRRNDGLRAIDALLSQWLLAVFCISALKLQRVTFDSSSGLLLEKIAAAEAVHRIRALSEMKNRLTNGRRCFGLFHPWYLRILDLYLI
jgi:malonyl-CoA decarboxylase